MSDEGRLVAGRYRIIRRIGTGAMGAVWQAQDEVLHRSVAIKQLLLQPGLEDHEAEDARQRTMREGRIAARLHHPNAITVFDVVTDDNGQPCLIMEYLESTSLAAVLQERRTLPPIEVARIGAQVAAALKEAHAVGIVHRDIKPGNILLTSSGLVKITDFGISRAKDDVTVTKTGMIAGTPAYLAPEVAIGGDPGPESDIFSLGSTLYAACEGQPPFGLSENTLGLLHAVAAGQINPPRQSGTLASVLAVLLHPEIQHRPTAEESEELLDAVARGETPLGGPSDETRMNPAGGMLAAGAAGAALGAAGTRAFSGDDLAGGHSGTLSPDDPAQGFYDHGSDYDPVDYADEPGYPAEDYDRGPAPTRAVSPVDRDPYDDGYDDPRPAAHPLDRHDDEEDEEPGRWKKPAAVGGLVLIALIALGVWVFSPRSADSSGPSPSPTSQPSAPPSSSSSSMTTEPTTEPSSSDTSSSNNGPTKKSSSKKTSERPPPGGQPTNPGGQDPEPPSTSEKPPSTKTTPPSTSEKPPTTTKTP
ncbi:serine/threonine-protein kinase [Amycolatopsis sp. CA-230715]|uniref:serine/threonine-protein kinase n=1 Tax=Amycolatopsis sp. CA-230715 TaxID=2745196 RepID=UPI001C02564E|nr:serine/threonine-protein kinase [Amycolatopsis sp. CA-230715]QWF79563.1 Serine/threonine-protein kinase PknD [Amycolatopsis sp. CA-230715]